ncbi:hypothetical protein ASPSYDRAFT_1165156 [Aspergillus sydowii CBS 593.65]|uniref:Uncharacterized protein n=1 Tax=Aspergillus sydowii CBS 593.65 TaxID=1036612 RepID=A0A1L9T025_9EURO|nr:uncharacterized protein ASPSYDRAFT_1165156 [Aspergillus sydowii CBS 593.65]OJJ52790.1 hypothetical protein ASPSYDRAFT_1165156 [Aspergillus sydowii CBS 593.65]
MSYYTGTPRRRGGASGGSNYTTNPGRGSGMHSDPSLHYEVPPPVSRPVDPINDPSPELGGRPPRDLGFSQAATVPGRTSATPSVRSSSSSSSASQHSRPGSRSGGATGSSAANPLSRQQSQSPRSHPFGAAGLPPPPPAGLGRAIDARAAADRAERARRPNPYRPGDLPPAPPGPTGMGLDPRPGASGQSPQQPDRHSSSGSSGKGGKKK